MFDYTVYDVVKTVAGNIKVLFSSRSLTKATEKMESLEDSSNVEVRSTVRVGKKCNCNCRKQSKEDVERNREFSMLDGV